MLRVLRIICLLTTLVAMAACSALTESEGGPTGENTPTPDGSSPNLAGTTVTLVTHDSFNLPKKLITRFEQETGMTLRIRKSGDAGKMTNSLVLNRANPTGDAAFGVDNTFASRAVEAGVFAEHGLRLPAGAEQFALDGDAADRLAPIDQGSVCVNVDTAWFARADKEPPETLDDLTDPAYENLFAVPGAATSSPGLAFFLATVAEYGEDGWQDYWRDLLANGATLTQGWSDAYYGEFSGGGDGDRPIVVSYDSSPAFTIDEKTGESTTAALLETCFRQVEYAGVLEGADNPAGAKRVLEFLLSDRVQSAIPDSMYMFPVSSSVDLPQEWAEHATPPQDPYAVPADEIAAHRQEWLTEWNDLVTR